MYKGTIITSRAKMYKAKQKAGQKKSTAGAGEQCCKISQTAKIRRLRNFATCEISQPCKTFTEFSFSSAFCAPIFLWFDHASSNSARVCRV